MVDHRFAKHCYDFDMFLKKSKKEFEAKWSQAFMPNANIEDFTVMRTLGTGSFGRVFLVKHNENENGVMAMKAMEKARLVKMKQVEHTISEIRIMESMKFEFLVGMNYFCKNNVYLFLVMPFINGGELFLHLRTQRKFDETLSKFYAAQVILAFEYMHNLGIVYRDLKPENILLDKEGYLKITDYGFCKKIDESRTYTLCGTPEYLAPEIIMSQGYNKSVDWWGIGILIFEMSAGFPPFYADDPMKIYEKIVSGKFQCPQHFSKALRHLVFNIIQVDRSKRSRNLKFSSEDCLISRYGILKNGAKDVKAHEWFKSLDWEAVLLKKLKPSFKPHVSHDQDLSNFETLEEEGLRVAREDEFPDEFSTFVVANNK